jgi:hypothetical protein
MCVRFCLPLPISLTLFIVTFSAVIFLTLTPNCPILCSAIPQPTTLSPILCIGYTALLKMFCNHFCWYVLPCRFEPHLLYNTFLFLGLSTYLNPWRFIVFTTDDVNDVKNFHCVFCFIFYVVSVVWSVLSSWLFLRLLICGLVHVLFLSLVVNF